MANTIKLKRSSTASDTPSASDLEVGELAINTADAKLFTKHTDNSIKEISGSGGSGTIASQDANNVDIDGGAIDGVTLGTNSAVTELQVDNININGNIISSTNTNGVIALNTNNTGKINLNANVQVGSWNGGATINTNGTGDLTLQPSSSLSSIVVADGSNGDITLTPNGTGSVVLDGLSYPQADGSNGHVLTTNGSGTLSFQPVSGGGGGIASVSADTNPSLGGTLDANSQLIQFGDSSGSTVNRLQFGGSQDLQIYHDGTVGRVATQYNGGDLYLSSFGDVLTYTGGYLRIGAHDGASGGVKLYYGEPPVLTAQTTSEGLDVETGILNIKNGGSPSEVRLFCESNNAHYVSLKAPAHTDFPNSNNQTLTLPAGTGTLLSDKNMDAGAIVSSGVDHVLVSVGGDLKRITTAHLGIGSGGGGGSYADADVDTHLNTSTASANEVLSWNGSDYDWVAQSGGGGGGSSNLTGLSDVNITSVADGDLLRYNGTASEWQNTNLGLTITPSISSFTSNTGGSTIYENSVVTAVVVPSSGSYQSPAYLAEVRNSTNTATIVSNANITRSGTSFSFTAPSAGSYIFRVKVQDFGDIVSEFATQSFTSVVPSGPRYFRIAGSGGTTHTMIMDIKFYSGPGQTGTVWPDTVGLMTNATTPSQFTASSSGSYNSSAYGEWEAFDSNTTSTNSAWWNLGTTTYANWYLQLDSGQQSTAIQSAKVKFGPYSWHGRAQTITLETSINGTNWTTQATYSKPNSGGTHYIG